jgi:hypothetical protein
MKLPTSARSAERSSRTSRRRPTRKRHYRPMKKKNQAVVVGPKVPLVGLRVLPAGQAGHLGGLADLLVGLRVLPVGQAGPLEGAEDDGPRKA